MGRTSGVTYAKAALRSGFLSISFLGCLLLIPVARAADPRVERLDCGLRVVVIEEPALPLVSVSLWYGVGSSADPPTQAGLTHIARAAMERRDDLDVRARVAGLHFDSHTYRDACVFQSFGVKTLLPFMLDVEAARVRPYSLSSTEVMNDARAHAMWPSSLQSPLENEFVLRPAVWRLDSLGASSRDSLPLDLPASQTLLRGVFGNHAYARPPELMAASLKDIDLAALNEHLARWFVPANATLIIQGDVEAVVVLDTVRRKLADLPWSDVPRLAASDRPDGETLHCAARNEASGVVVAWWMPAWVLPENVGVHMLLHQLCNPVDGALTSRLLAAGCEPPRWDMLNFREAGAAVLFVPMRAGHDFEERARAVERIVREELLAESNAPANLVALRRAKSLAISDLRTTRAGLQSRALLFGAYDQIAGDLFLAQFDQRRIERMTPAAQRAAADHLLKTRTVVMRVSSDSPDDGKGLPTPDAGNTAMVSGQTLLSNNEKVLSTLEGVNAPALPEIHNGVIGGFGALEVISIAELPTSSVITLVPASRMPRVLLESRLAQSSGRYSQPDLRDLLSYRGWTLRVVNTNDEIGLASDGPPSDWPQLLELQGEILQSLTGVSVGFDTVRAAFSQREYESDQEYADRLIARLADPTSIAVERQLPPSSQPVGQSLRCIVVCGDPYDRVAKFAADTWHDAPEQANTSNLPTIFNSKFGIPIYWALGSDRGLIRMMQRADPSNRGMHEYSAALHCARFRDHVGFLSGRPNRGDAFYYWSDGAAFFMGFPVDESACNWVDQTIGVFYALGEFTPANALSIAVTKRAMPLHYMATWDESSAVAHELAIRADRGSAQLIPPVVHELDRYGARAELAILIVGDSDDVAEAAEKDRVIPLP